MTYLENFRIKLGKREMMFNLCYPLKKNWIFLKNIIIIVMVAYMRGRWGSRRDSAMFLSNENISQHNLYIEQHAQLDQPQSGLVINSEHLIGT